MPKTYYLIVGLFIISTISFSSCSQSRKTTTSQNYQQYISKYKWKLIQLNGQTLPSSTAYLTFDIKEGRFSGSGGCNRIFGSFTSDATSFTFGAAASTLIACADTSVMRIERDFKRALDLQKFSYDVADQTLNLYRDNRIILMFGRMELTKE